MHTLRYLSGTADFGLLYLPCVKGDLGEADHLQLPRAVDRLEVYADVSYSPSHEAFRSIQGIAVEHAGNLVAWESCIQQQNPSWSVILKVIRLENQLDTCYLRLDVMSGCSCTETIVLQYQRSDP